MTESKIKVFAGEARAFCSWAVGSDGSAMTVASALSRVASLYNSALSLSEPWSESLPEDIPDIQLATMNIDAMTARVSQLPIQFYWDVFDPFEVPPKEPFERHLLDDIGDIYRDVAGGLVLFDEGRADEALWEWGYNFRIHWGAHATSAIRALHAYLSHEHPDGLSRES
jgi:hypothetical protein